jgi:hypothetical protein
MATLPAQFVRFYQTFEEGKFKELVNSTAFPPITTFKPVYLDSTLNPSVCANPAFNDVQPFIYNRYAVLITPAGFTKAVPITVNTIVEAASAAASVFVGASKAYDFYVGGQWVSFGTVPVGILPINASGARVTSGGASPSSGDITFLS